ncbi:SPOR domain-containing protein, partial [Trichothermofontia sp.]
PTPATSALPRLPVSATAAPAPPRVPVVTPTAPSANHSQVSGDNTALSQPNTQPNTYNVVTEYRGNDSLAKLQQVAPGAYLRNFNNGIRVQLGTFDDRASAQSMVEQLNQQGISATVQAE